MNAINQPLFGAKLISSQGELFLENGGKALGPARFRDSVLKVFIALPGAVLRMTLRFWKPPKYIIVAPFFKNL